MNKKFSFDTDEDDAATVAREKTTAPPVQPRRRFLRQWWVWLLILAVTGVSIYAYLHSGNVQTGPTAGVKARPNVLPSRRQAQNAPPAPRPIPVVAAPAHVGDINVYLNGIGSVIPLNTVTVKSRVDGELMRVLFNEGQLVKRGQLLAELDPRPFQVQLTQALGQMARDSALLANARIDLERYRTLFKQDSIAQQQLATQESLVRQYEGTVKFDQGQIDNARLQLIYTRITSPVDGRVGLRQVDPGNIVHATDTNGLVVITQLQPLYVVFTIPEDSIRKVVQQLEAGEKMPVDAYDREQRNKLATGFLASADNQIDPTTGTVKLKAQFTNENYSLFPNQFVNARLLLDTRRDVTITPSAAVQRGSQGTFAYVVRNDNTVTVRPIRAGIVQGENTEILDGLKPGELVVVDGADKLRDGARIALTTKSGTTAPAGQKNGGQG